MDCFDSFLKEDVNNYVVHIKLNPKANFYFKVADNLYAFVNSKYIENRTNYLLIDEVQSCSNFEVVINPIYEESLFNILINGSNAFLFC